MAGARRGLPDRVICCVCHVSRCRDHNWVQEYRPLGESGSKRSERLNHPASCRLRSLELWPDLHQNGIDSAFHESQGALRPAASSFGTVPGLILGSAHHGPMKRQLPACTIDV